MMKVVALTPCLMLPNNEKYNKKCLEQNYSLGFDEYVIYDQCFAESDFDPRFTYIGHAKERVGWVAARNALLEWFYNSDYDYCFWIDANSAVTKTSMNDIHTILKNLREGNLSQCDAIFGTLGMWVSQDRIIAKSAEDYKQKVHLIPAKNNKSYNWMHGLILHNFKKYNNQEFYIDTRCDTKVGIAEDVYFSRLLRQFTSCWVAPTVVCSKPTSQASTTFASNDGKYNYPPVDYTTIERFITERAFENSYKHCSPTVVPQEIILDRTDFMKDELKDYAPRGARKKPVSDTRVSLF